MTADQFRRWLDRNRYTKAGAGRDLHRSREMIRMYVSGQYAVERDVDLACEAIEARRAPLIAARPHARILPALADLETLFPSWDVMRNATTADYAIALRRHESD